MRSMVEGGFAGSAELRVFPPLHHPSGGPPPPTGEEGCESAHYGFSTTAPSRCCSFISRGYGGWRYWRKPSA